MNLKRPVYFYPYYYPLHVLIVLMVLIGGIFCNFIGASPVYASAVSRDSFPSSAISVKAAYIKTAKFVKYVSVLGEIHSNKKSILYAPFSGTVFEPFSGPSVVYSGTVAARIVKPGLYAKIVSAEASVNYSRIELKRTNLLFHDGVDSKKDVERARLSFIVSVSNLKTLESENSEGILISSFKGSIKYLVPNGTPVNAGIPIAVVSGRGIPFLKAFVTPGQAQAIKKLLKERKETATIISQGFKVSGKIFLIGDDARHFGLVPVYVKLKNHKGNASGSYFLPGEWVKLRFSEFMGTAYSVPENAVIIYKNKKTIFIVKKNKAVAVPVRVVGMKGGKIFVRGLIQGSIKTIYLKRRLVIVHPVSRLNSGVFVRID